MGGEMSDRTFARKKTNTTNFAQPSLVSSTTPTLANPTRGFGVTNNVIQKAADISTEQTEVQAGNERSSSEQLTIQEKPLTHDISRISFHRPQAKLTVGEPGDQYEQEADWVANRIMRMAIPNQVNTSVQTGEDLLQRKCAACEEEEKLENIQTKSIIQRDDIPGLPPVPNYQLTPPSLLQPRDPASRYRLGGDTSLHLDPQFQVMMQQVQQQVNPATVRTGLDQVNLQLPTSSITTPETPNPFAIPATTTADSSSAPTTDEPTTPRAGNPGDIIRAVLRMPQIDAAVTSLQTQVGDRITQDWQRLNTGERIATVSTLVAIGGGALAGIISDPSARRFALDQLNGRAIPVPYLNWLHLEINTASDNLMLGLHIDVGQLLPPSWGFRGSSPDAIGGPPQPEPLLGMVQRQMDSEGNTQTSTDLESRLNSSKGGGSPLGDTVRSFMEPRVGADFSNVRVHTDSTAVQMNRELGAQAFTHGSDVYFGAGKAPGNNELTAHELTHVVQQTGVVQRMFIQAGSVGQDRLQMMPPKIKTASLSIEEAQILLSKANKELAFELAQTAVDIAGIADPTPISDGISAAMSLAKGDYVGAGLSMISMIPYLGDAVGKPIKAARNAKKVVKLRKEIAELIQIIKKIDPEVIKKAEQTKEVVSQEIKTVFQQTVKKTEKTIGNTDPKPWKQGAFHGTKPKYENPGHHDPSKKNFRGGGSKTSILPNDAEEVYLKAIPSPDGKTWWGKNSQGEIYRYQFHEDGKIHWNGRENSPRGLTVPHYIQKRLKNFPLK
jgi:hypothetical protein